MAKETVNIDINFNESGELTVSKDTLHVSKSIDGEVIWNCPSGNYFTVDFGNDSPFYESQFSTKRPCSGLVRRDVLPDPGRRYKYTVRVNGKTLDPGSIVDP